jgi:exodeoxyribonuclease V beta subunit
MHNTETIPEFDLLSTTLAGKNLIEASAGTGKTFCITRLFIRLLLEKELPVQSILVVTFTEAATRELRERIFKLLLDTIDAFKTKKTDDPLLTKLIGVIDHKKAADLLTNAIQTFDSASIFTIHGFCQNILKDFAFECNTSFNNEIIKDQYAIERECILDFWRINFHSLSPMFAKFCLSEGVSPDYFFDIYNEVKNHHQLHYPVIIDTIDFIEEESAFTNAFEMLKCQWIEAKEDIISIFNSGKLKANRYKQETIYEIIVSMNRFLQQNEPDPLLFNKFDHFTSESIQKFTKTGQTGVSHPFFEQCEIFLEAHEQLKQKYSLFIARQKRDFITFMRKKLHDTKKGKNVLYFDDLLLDVYNTLKDPLKRTRLASQVISKYRAALIDEFQDTDPIQYYIFSTIFFNNQTIIYLIGDPKQAIYSFRGADIFTYLKAAEDTSCKFTLTTNYRSSPSLVYGVSHFFESHSNPFFNKLIKYHLPKGTLSVSGDLIIDTVIRKPVTVCYISEQTLHTAENKNSIMTRVVCSKITSLLNKGSSNQAYIGNAPINPSNIAILVRTNPEANQYKDELSLSGIPAVIDSSASVFTTDESMELYRLLCAIAEPEQAQLVNAALCLPFFNYTCSQIELMHDDLQMYHHILEMFSIYQNLWFDNGFEYMIRKFFIDHHIRQKILSFNGGMRKLTNYLHLIELIERESITLKCNYSTLLKWFYEKIVSSDKSVPDEHMVRLDNDKASVRIVTIHKSKGLEFDIVFCPTLWMHGSDIKKSNVLICHNDNNDAICLTDNNDIQNWLTTAENELLSENMRLCYVALTRAKFACYLFYSCQNAPVSSALNYLLFGQHSSFSTVREFKSFIKQLPESQIIEHLGKLSNSPYIHFEITESVKNSTDIALHTFENNALHCLEFNSKIPEPWKISSFTSLTLSKSNDMIHHDHYDSEFDTDLDIRDDNALSMFTFPKGAQTGNFFHSLLEHIDFASYKNTDILSDITRLLKKYNFDSKWSMAVLDLLHHLTSCPLTTNKDSFRLQDIVNNVIYKELEFFFPIHHLTNKGLYNVFSNQKQMNIFETEYQADNLTFSPVKGYMKGYIDMVFQHNGLFYVIDWKSNYLGRSFDCYNPENLSLIMTSKQYVLQYHLYTIALHKYLTRYHNNYSYDKCFGGVFYIFLRGVNTCATSGIYYNKPDFSIIQGLEQLLLK